MGEGKVPMSELFYRYIFRGKTNNFSYTVTLDKDSLRLVSKEVAKAPDWVQLNNNKCSHCPLLQEDSPQCPVAMSLHDLCQSFMGSKSYDQYDITVETNHRSYAYNTDLQTGLKSLFGLIMPTCGCPHTKFLRPLTRFHLPFDDFESTVQRSLGNYLIARFLSPEIKNSEIADLNDLKILYENIGLVNKFFMRRIQSHINASDANQNAIVILNSISELMAIEWETNFESIAHLYAV